MLRLGKYQNGSCYCQLRKLRLVAIFQMAGTGKSQDFGTSSSVQSLGRLTYQVNLFVKQNVLIHIYHIVVVGSKTYLTIQLSHKSSLISSYLCLPPEPVHGVGL